MSMSHLEVPDGSQPYTVSSKTWPRSFEVVAVQVQGFAGSWLRVPLAFVTGSHFNNWSFVVELLDNLVNEPCRLLDSNGVPVDDGLPPSAGDYRMVPRGGEPHFYVLGVEMATSDFQYRSYCVQLEERARVEQCSR